MSNLDLYSYIRKIHDPQTDFVDRPQKILFINNFDSFVYNLVDYICTLSTAQVKIVPNTVSLDEVTTFNPDKILISPGPGHPKYDSGSVIPLIQKYTGKIPIFGVCLGFQAMCEAFGEDPAVEYVGRAKVGPKHGKVSKIFHDGDGAFTGLPNPTYVVRYHSLAAKSDILPAVLKITAMADDGTIMAIRHRVYPVFGVQFHPESIMMKPHGKHMLLNFLQM